MSDETEVKTMWSESLLETLYIALEKKKSNKLIIDVLKDLRAKGFEKNYIIEKVEKKVDAEAASRVRAIFSAAAASKQSSGSGKPAAKKPEGVMSKLKGMFK